MDTYNDPVINICIDFGFQAARSGGDFAFWFNLAEKRRANLFGDSPVPSEVWGKVRDMVRRDYPDLVAKYPLLRQFVENPDFEFPAF